jgi:CRISPR-associated endoribonuclease Cas6
VLGTVPPAPRVPLGTTESLPARVQLTAHRLFHYELPRISFRQQKRLDFDGVIGYLDLSCDLPALEPWARAAEVFHFGQKAAFGLGKVRVLEM